MSLPQALNSGYLLAGIVALVLKRVRARQLRRWTGCPGARERPRPGAPGQTPAVMTAPHRPFSNPPGAGLPGITSAGPFGSH